MQNYDTSMQIYFSSSVPFSAKMAGLFIVYFSAEKWNCFFGSFIICL